MAEDSLVLTKTSGSWFWGLFNWTQSSTTMLRSTEKSILSFLKSSYRGFYVDIGPAVGDADKIWTLNINSESSETPLILLHGLGAGVGLWVMNLDTLAQKRPVYAMDMLGFGRSSRPKFSNEALIAEKQFVKSVEEWRREMNIDRMILLGHSMGGYIATSYAISYPERVKHLILADPWGFPERPNEQQQSKAHIPLWVRAIAYAVSPLNPLWALRAAGPFGQWIVEKTRPDITRKFSSFIKDDRLIPQYIHQCNIQDPTGESAFHAMMTNYGWAKNPMMNRIHELRSDIPITLLYGSRSWIDSSTGEKVKRLRPNSYVNIQVISGAGHHVYADKPEIFNKYVNDACEIKFDDSVNSNKQQQSMKTINDDGTESDQESEKSNQGSEIQRTISDSNP